MEKRVLLGMSGGVDSSVSAMQIVKLQWLLFDQLDKGLVVEKYNSQTNYRYTNL